MGPEKAVSEPAADAASCRFCCFIVWLADPDRQRSPGPTGLLRHAGGWLLAPSLAGLVVSVLLSPYAPVLSLALLVAAILGTAVFLWMLEHARARRLNLLDETLPSSRPSRLRDAPTL